MAEVTETARVREVRSLDEWSALLAGRERPSFLQSWEWGELKRRFGWTPVRLAVSSPDSRPGGVQMLVKTRRILPILPRLGIAYVPRAPFGDATEHQFRELIDAAVKRARRAGASFIRAEPAAECSGAALAAMREAGFKPAPQYVQIRSTAYVALDRSEDDILAGFKPKTRYNVRLAMRRGVDVRVADSEADLDSFYRLTAATGRRDGFAVHGPGYYRAIWDALGESRRLFIASVNGEDVGALFAAICGDMATYLYGASSDRYRNTMSSYLLQWEAMLWARRRGCSTYDFWGMADPDAKNDPMAGVHRFKAGFRPRLVRHAGTLDLPLQASTYLAITRIALPTRTLLQGLLSRRRRPAAAV